MPQKIECYLKALKEHLNINNHPESKLSVIYQYLMLSKKENKTSEQNRQLVGFKK